MKKSKRIEEHEAELNFDTTGVDSFSSNQTREEGLFNTIINEGEDAAREIHGDDVVDRALVRRGQARNYTPSI